MTSDYWIICWIQCFFASQQNSIDNGDLDMFYISHNNDNGGNESICTYLANSCNGNLPEDLLVGKISDNGILLAWMIHLLHQNQLCNGPILTVFKSLFVFLLIDIALGMTEQNHPLRASTLVAGGSVSLQASIAILLHFECL
jgi:hypothetical protein